MPAPEQSHEHSSYVHGAGRDPLKATKAEAEARLVVQSEEQNAARCVEQDGRSRLKETLFLHTLPSFA